MRPALQAIRSLSVNLALAFLLASPALVASAPVAPARAEVPFEALVSGLEQRIDEATEQVNREEGRDELLAIRQFYEGRGFHPAWIDEERVNEQGRIIARTILDSAVDGLVPENYYADVLRQSLHAESEGELVEAEFAITRSLIHYGRDLSAGRVEPSKVDSEYFIYPDPVKSLNLLSTAAATDDLEGYLASLAPQSDNYARLKAAVADYRKVAAEGGWTKVPEGEEMLEPGMLDARVPSLRVRLQETGDLRAEPDSDVALYDADLERAVKFFQYRHGLTEDGVVGPKTLEALNTPVEQRIETMLLNMERRRWMPDDLGQTYVFVNLADYFMKVVDEPKTIFATRVVVGKPYHQTPVFSDQMSYLEVNPYWNVPPSIARNEILPAVKKNPNYFTEKNMQVLSGWSQDAAILDPAQIDWNAIGAGELSYKFRQEPGEGNALGRIKFMFPNRFNIYLHDTPAKNLFQRTERAFSHGCVRVQEPIDLATVLLRDMPEWDRERILETIASGERTIVNLDRKIPVHVTYLTAWVNKDGSVHFRDDIYERDKRLRQALIRSHVTGKVGSVTPDDVSPAEQKEETAGEPI